MVLVTFAETKVTRRVGTKPHINNVQQVNGKRLRLGKVFLKKSREFRLFNLPFSRQQQLTIGEKMSGGVGFKRVLFFNAPATARNVHFSLANSNMSILRCDRF